MKRYLPLFTRVILLALLAICAISQYSLADDWPTYRHDARRSGIASERLNAENLVDHWTWKSAAWPQPAWAGPAKWDAYAGIRGLRAMRNYDPVFHTIAVGDHVYFGSSVDDAVHCLDLVTGSQRWTFTTDAPVRIAPTYDNGRLYFGSDDGNAYCISADDGRLIWKYSPSAVTKPVLINGRTSSYWPCRTGVLVKDGIAYFAASLLPWKQSYLCAVNTKTGLPEGPGCFVAEHSSMTMEGPLVASADLLIVPQGRVAPQLFSRADGKSKGSLKGGGGSFVVMAEDENVYHGPGNKTGWITSSNAKTGAQIATYKQGNAIIISGSQSFMLTDEAIIATDFVKRKVLWNVPSDGPLEFVLSGETLFVGTTDKVFALSTKDGRQTWSHLVDGKAFGLTISGGRLLVSTDTGSIHAFAAGVAIAVAEPKLAVADAASQVPLAKVSDIKDADLLGRWVFQTPHIEGRKVLDLAGDSDATVKGTAGLVTVEQHQALALDGSSNSIMIVPDYHKANLPKQAITAEAWVQVDQTSAWGGIIGAFQDNGSFERGWILGTRDQKFCFALRADQGNSQLTYLTAEKDFALGQWHHVVGTYDGTTMSLYVDGRLAAKSTTQAGNISYPPQAFYEMGAYHDKDEYYRLRGAIHEVRVYQRAVTANEVSRHFQSKALGAAEPVQLALGPWAQFQPGSRVTISWQTDTPMPSQLELQLDGQTFVQSDTTPKTSHQIEIDSLKKNRIYSYVIKTETAGKQQVAGPFELDTHFNYTIGGRVESPQNNSAAAQDARATLSKHGSDTGLCVVVGVHDGAYISELLAQSSLRIIAFDTGIERVMAARSKLSGKSLYGIRASVHHVASFDNLPMTGNCANLIVSERVMAGEPMPGGPTEWHRILAPSTSSAAWKEPADRQGGSIILRAASGTELKLKQWKTHFPGTYRTSKAADSGEATWLFVKRDPIVGASEWTHLYGSADNSSFAGEHLSGAEGIDDLEVQWLGRPGPRFQPDRNGRKPAPLSTGGKLFAQGLHRIVALDAYNGLINWSLEIPDLQRFNMPRDCSNWCADADNLFVAIRERCWVIGTSDGSLAKTYGAAAPKESKSKYDWGYVARHGQMLLGSSVRQGATWTNFWGGSGSGWYDAKSGEVTASICSDNLFAYQTGDADGSQPAWVYQRGVILNPSITVADNRIFFLECRNADLVAGDRRRLEAVDAWKDLYLVSLDVSSGKVLWQQPFETTQGTVVSYLTHGQGSLVFVASADNKYHVYSFDAEKGTPNWNVSFPWQSDNHGGHMSHPAIGNGVVYVRPRAIDLASGKLLDLTVPKGGCGTYCLSTNALFFRAGNVTMWDRSSDEVTSWNRLRPGCWLSAIPAAGMLLSPEAGGGCSCGSWMETSIGFIPRNLSVQ